MNVNYDRNNNILRTRTVPDLEQKKGLSNTDTNGGALRGIIITQGRSEEGNGTISLHAGKFKIIINKKYHS